MSKSTFLIYPRPTFLETVYQEEETVGWKSLRAATFYIEIQTFHIVEMTQFPTSADQPFLKDRVLRLWNPNVSSSKAAIATQPPKKE